jgi:hypothetical protein
MVEDFRKWGAESFGEGLFCLKERALMRPAFQGSHWLTGAMMSLQESMERQKSN